MNVGSSGVGFQPYPQASQVIIINSEETPHYTSIINLSKRSSALVGKESLGTSEIFLNAGNPSSDGAGRAARK